MKKEQSILLTNEMKEQMKKEAESGAAATAAVAQALLASSKDIEALRQLELKKLYLYNLKEVEEATGIKLHRLREYIKNGELKAAKIGREYKVSQPNLQEFINNLTK